MRAALASKENKGLLVAVLRGVVLTALILVAVLPEGSPWRNEDADFLPESPLLDSIAFIAVASFTAVGTACGLITGTLRTTRDAVAMMSGALKEMLPFIVLASELNLFIISGSGMWAMMGAVFVPMFALIGYEPAFTQAVFRVGDSAAQVITPMNPYTIVLLGMLRKYEPAAGLGTLMARMLPFVIPFWLVWTAILAVFFFFFDLPIGPGNGIVTG